MSEPGFATWAIELVDRDLAVAAALRTRPDVRATVLADRAWVCGSDNSAECTALGARIPGAVHYRVDGDGRLFIGSRRLPSGTLPSAPWLPLSDLLPVQVQVQVANVGVEPLRLELLASNAEQPVAAVLLPRPEFNVWVEQAPAHRFSPLRFAVTHEQQVLILGTPLPPLRGTPLWGCGPLLIPCGMALAPAVPVTWLERTLALPAGDLVLVRGGDWQRIAASSITPLTRAVARSDAW